MLSAPEHEWLVMTLCRASDADRAAKFHRACVALGATGIMADMDDEPAQIPLDLEQTKNTIVEMLPQRAFDSIYTHGPLGEYTYHRRHGECCRAVASLCVDGRLAASQINLFAYTDRKRSTLPVVAPDANERDVLPSGLFKQKLHIIEGIYGYARDSWEARTTPAEEGYYVYRDPAKLHQFVDAQQGALVCPKREI